MNRIERMKAVFEKKTPDHVPAGFWFHYPASLTAKEMADAHVALNRETGMDIIKIMDDSFGSFITQGITITKASDWRNITLPGKNCGQYQKMLEVIKEIASQTGGEVMIFPTFWSPFKIASFTYGACGSSDAVFMEHCKEDPESVLCGINAIAAAFEEWVPDYIAAGASGVYYSGQFSEPQRFSKEQWETLVKPSDLRILNAVKKQGGYNIIHICGEAEFDFNSSPQWYKGYPGDLFNWAVHHNDLSLEEGWELFGTAILGGLDNRGVLVNGTPDQVKAEVEAVIARFGKQGFMLGADCTVPSDVSIANLKAAVEAAAAL